MASLRKFIGAREGNVAVMFGLLTLPLLGLAGAAIDYSLAARDRSAIQEAIDAGALAGARLLGVQTEAQARAQAESFVRTNLPQRLQTIPLNIQVVNNGRSVRITASSSTPTSILQVLGRSSIDVSAASTANAPAYREIELVLSLDNTGSMAQSGKIQALRTASLELLTILENSGRRAGDIRVGLVPFNSVVRVDAPTYYQASWLRGVPNGGNGNGSGFTSGNGRVSWGNGHQSWYGCVQDRDPPYNTNDTGATNNGTRFPAVECDSNQRNMARVVPLTSDFATVRSGINAMIPVGTTNVTIGVAWGWHLLSSNVPFTETQSTADSVDRWLVVLTDGDNTQDRWGGNQTAIDNRTRAVCNNLRSQEPTIRVVTVRVIQGNANLLRSCASNSSYYYEVSNSSQLVDVFRRIAWEITALRLSH